MFGVDLREQNYVYIHFQLNRHTLIRSWRKLNTSRIDRIQSAYHCCIRDSPQIITINCFPSTIETYYHFGSNAEFDVIAVASGRFARLPPKAAHVPRASTHLPARANHLWRALQRTVTEFTSVGYLLPVVWCNGRLMLALETDSLFPVENDSRKKWQTFI